MGTQKDLVLYSERGLRNFINLWDTLFKKVNLQKIALTIDIQCKV